jgi:hypothetical protein
VRPGRSGQGATFQPTGTRTWVRGEGVQKSGQRWVSKGVRSACLQAAAACEKGARVQGLQGGQNKTWSALPSLRSPVPDHVRGVAELFQEGGQQRVVEAEAQVRALGEGHVEARVDHVAPAEDRGARRRADGPVYEGALSFVTTIRSSRRDSPYKIEWGRENCRRPSSKRAGCGSCRAQPPRRRSRRCAACRSARCLAIGGKVIKCQYSYERAQ